MHVLFFKVLACVWKIMSPLMCIFFPSELVEFKVCVLLAIFVFLEVRNSLHQTRCPTCPSVSGAYSVLGRVHQVQLASHRKQINAKLSILNRHKIRQAHFD